MTDTEALQKVQKAVVECMNTAVAVFPELKEAPPLKINIDLTGRCGGMYVYKTGTDYHKVRINRILLDENEETILGQTVPHEVAHFIVRFLYGGEKDFRTGRRKVQPHGRQWKMIMGVLGKKAQRCHNMDTTNSARKVNRFEYKCGCKTYKLSTIRHKRIVNHGQTYFCKQCGDTLVLVGDTPVMAMVKKIPKTSVFVKGQTVKFKGTKGRIISGKIERVNKKTLTINAHEAGLWRVSPVYIIN